MAGENNSPNMSLPVPGVSVTDGPQWAQDLDNCLIIIDAHNHSAGSGVQITPSGLNINSDLPFQVNNATLLRSVRFSPQVSPLALSTDIGCIYESGVDLYYNDGNGNPVRLTQSGAVAGTPGSIANLVPPASASYVALNQTFVFQSAANTPGNIDGGSFIFRNVLTNSHGVTVSPPAALGSDYALVLPQLPGQTNVMTLDSSGNMGSVTFDAVGQNMTSVGVNAIIATSNNANFPGNSVQESGLNVVVSNTNAASSLAIVRGAVDASGGITDGEGFTASRLGAGVYQINFSGAFASTPSVVACCVLANTTIVVNNINQSLFIVRVNNLASSANDGGFNFIAIGPRA